MVRGMAWSVPVVAAGITVPMAAASGEQCYLGEFALKADFTVATGVRDGAFMRFDTTIKVTNTMAPGYVYSDMHFVIPFGWTGPKQHGQAGPFTAATWDDASGHWNSVDYPGDYFYLSEHQTLTPAPRTPFAVFGTGSLYNPSAPTSSTAGGAAPNQVASLTSNVYALPIPGSLALGQSATTKISFVVTSPSTSYMQTRFFGHVMLKACLDNQRSGRSSIGISQPPMAVVSVNSAQTPGES